MLTLAAFVEYRRRLVRRPNLNLHVVRASVITLWTLSVRSVHILPRLRTAQYVVDLLARKHGPLLVHFIVSDWL